MTETEHADISRRLALAIGHPSASVQTFNPPQDMRIVVWSGTGFRAFDYRDPAVIFPIAERFNCFPRNYCNSGLWFASASIMQRDRVSADTAALAVALAVIKAKEAK